MSPEQEIRSRFRNVTVSSDKADELTELRFLFEALALELSGTLPSGRELSLAMTKLEEAQMWAVKAATVVERRSES